MNFYSRVAILVVAVMFAGIRANQLDTIGDNYTSYRLQVPGSNKSITIIEANTAASRPAITPEHVQHLRERHYQQQRQQHQQHASNATRHHGDDPATDQYYYDRQRPQHDADDNDNRAPAKVNQRADHDYAAAAAAATDSRSPSSQQRYHYPTKSIGSADRNNRQRDAVGDVRASIALNVYDRDDDDDGDEFIQPNAADNTFLKKRKVAAVSTPTAMLLHAQHEHDDSADSASGDRNANDRSPVSDDDRKNPSAAKNAYSPLLLQQFIKTYTAKLKLGEPKVKAGSAQSVEAEADAALDRRYNWNDNRDGAVGTAEQPTNVRPSAANPFSDKKGWVTLEAVPWSSSKVSKWHAHVDKTGASDGSQMDDSSGYYNQADRLRPHPQAASLHYDDVGGADDEYVYSNRPQQQQQLQQLGTSARPAIYTTYNPSYRPPSGPSSATHRPTKYPSASAADSYYDSTDRPYYSHQRPPTSSSHGVDYFAPPEVEDNFHHHQHRDKWYEHTSGSGGTERPRPQPQSAQRPNWHEADIITDNRPFASDFPKHPAYAQPQPQQRPLRTGPASAGSSSGSSAYNLHDRLDSTHPDSGHGEWVLVSANKGYQAPPVRHGQRAIHLRPVYGDTSPSSPGQSPSSSANDMVSHHSVRLTVLPPLPDTNTFSSDRRRPQMVLSHGGLLEVESSFDTVDNSVAGAFSGAAPAPGAGSSGAVNEPSAAPTKPKRRVFKGVPLKSRTGNGPDASAVIAAVSAGMVPATMAMMMPIVLGRKRRSEATDVSPHGHANVDAGLGLRLPNSMRHR